MPQYELNLRDYWRIVKKKKVIVIVTVIMLGAFSFFFAIMNKPVPLYRATTSLKIEKSSSLSGLYVQSVSWGSGDELATRAEIIKSYPMIEKAAQVLGLIDSSVSSEEIRTNQKYFKIVSELKTKVKTEQEGYTNIINIMITSYDSKESCNLANALAKVYTIEDYKEKNSQTNKALKTVKEQLTKAEKALRESEKKVRNYREQHKFVTLSGSAVRLTAKLGEAETKLEKIRSDITQIENILFEIEQNPDYIYFSSFKLLLNQPNPVLDGIQTQMNQLRSRLNNYSQYYTPEHPIIKDIKIQIRNKEKRFIAELKAFRETFIHAEIAAQEKWEKFDKEYKALPLQGLTLDNLERELGINTRLYQESKLRHQEALIKQSEQVHEVFIIRPAFLPTHPINPTMIGPTTAVGAIIGLILGIVLAFIAETLDTTFTTIDDIEKTLDTTVLGIIPFVSTEDIKSKLEEKITTPVSDEILQMQARLVSHYDPKSTMAESFRALRTNTHFALLDKGYKTVMITSSVAGEGKTSIAVNLAVSMAQIGLNTLLLESDLRKPRISKLFGIDREPGLTDIILRKQNLESVIRNMTDLMLGTMALDLFRSDKIPGIEYLNILTCGRIERNPSEIIASKLMDDLLDEIKERYDLIILDSAPIIQATDSTILGSKVDTVILTYYQGKVSRGTLRRSKNQIEILKSDILGVVINGMKADISADYADYKYSYDYRYSYGESQEEEKNKVISFLKSFFLYKKEGIVASFYQRIRKLRVLALFGAIALLFGGGCLLSNIFMSSKHEKTSYVESQTTSQEDIQQIMTKKDTSQIPLEEKSSVYDIPKAVPSELKKIAGQYGIKPSSDAFIIPPAAISKSTITPPEFKEELPSQPIKTEPQPKQYITMTKTRDQEFSPVYLEESPSTSSNIIGASQPYSLLLKRIPNFTSAKQEVENLRERGLPAFATVDFSDPEQKIYLICYGNFQSSSKARKKSNELLFLGFNGQFKLIKFPFAISLGKFPTEEAALVYLKEFPNMKEFAYLQPSNFITNNVTEHFLLIGGFNSEESAHLFKQTKPELISKNVILR